MVGGATAVTAEDEEEEVVVVVLATEEEEEEDDDDEGLWGKESSWPLSEERSEQERRSTVCREAQRRSSGTHCSVTFTQPWGAGAHTHTHTHTHTYTHTLSVTSKHKINTLCNVRRQSFQHTMTGIQHAWVYACLFACRRARRCVHECVCTC